MPIIERVQLTDRFSVDAEVVFYRQGERDCTAQRNCFSGTCIHKQVLDRVAVDHIDHDTVIHIYVGAALSVFSRDSVIVGVLYASPTRRQVCFVMT